MAGHDTSRDPDRPDKTLAGKTPSTSEKLDKLVDRYILGNPHVYRHLVRDDGPNTARIILRNRFGTGDPRLAPHRE